MEVARGDISALLAAGWRPPDVFAAKGRDGMTDIWGHHHSPDKLRPFQEVSGH